MDDYVHGYSGREALRLSDQANTLARILYDDIIYTPGSRILECGCGTGAQTVHLAPQNPKAEILSVDISEDSLTRAQAELEKRGINNVVLQKADIYNLPFGPESFDHVFICFVLEHLPEPKKALENLKKILRKGGTITVIEGDHGSWYCYPETSLAAKTVQCLIDVQTGLKGDSLIGRRLFPLIESTGFNNVRVEPKMIYVDGSKPDLVEGFSKNTFIAMVEAVEEKAISMGLIKKEEWDRGIRDLYRATGPDGTFCYTFFKAVAVK